MKVYATPKVPVLDVGFYFSEAGCIASLTPQQTRFTCGPASLAAVYNLLTGVQIDQERLARELATTTIGTDHEVLGQWATENLPVECMGTDPYEGGLSIFNHRALLSGGGHFAVILGCSDCGEFLKIWDPHFPDRGTLIVRREQIDWTNSDGSLAGWHCKIDTGGRNFFGENIGSAPLPTEKYCDTIPLATRTR